MADPVSASPAESLGTRLRRLAGDAAALKLNQSFGLHPPLRLPQPWSANSTVEAGEVRAANGNWYVSGKTGGTAASGNGPSSAATSALIQDGATAWAFLCRAPVMANSPLAPAVTRQVAPTPPGLPNYFNCISSPGAFRVTGAYPVPYFASFWQLWSFNPNRSGPSGVSSRISFVTDAPKFAFGATNGSGPARVLIDGQYVDAGGLTFARGGSPTWIILDFSASGRAIRNVTLEFGFGQTFAGVAVTPDDSVWAPAAPDTLRCAFISDSLAAGSVFGPFLPGGDAPSIMSRMLGWDDCWNCSVSGTGYVASGSDAFFTYGQRVPELLARKPDIWIFMGSINDIGASLEAVRAAALAAFRAIRAGGSNAPIIVFGVWSIRNDGLAAVEAAVRSAVTQFADRQTFFIPIYGDPVLPWITGTWNNTRNVNSVNAGLYAGSDGIHPTETGTLFEGVRLANAISASVLPNIP